MSEKKILELHFNRLYKTIVEHFGSVLVLPLEIEEINSWDLRAQCRFHIGSVEATFHVETCKETLEDGQDVGWRTANLKLENVPDEGELICYRIMGWHGEEYPELEARFLICWIAEKLEDEFPYSPREQRLAWKIEEQEKKLDRLYSSFSERLEELEHWRGQCPA